MYNRRTADGIEHDGQELLLLLYGNYFVGYDVWFISPAVPQIAGCFFVVLS